MRETSWKAGDQREETETDWNSSMRERMSNLLLSLVLSVPILFVARYQEIRYNTVSWYSYARLTELLSPTFKRTEDYQDNLPCRTQSSIRQNKIVMAKFRVCLKKDALCTHSQVRKFVKILGIRTCLSELLLIDFLQVQQTKSLREETSASKVLNSRD